jgi:hypothetical protein
LGPFNQRLLGYESGARDRGLNLIKLRNRITKETFNKIMCLRSWGIIIDDIEGEDTDKDIANIVEDLDEAVFSL